MHPRFRWFVLVSLAAVSICVSTAQADTVVPIISTSGLIPADFVETYHEAGGIHVGSAYTANGGGEMGVRRFLDHPNGANVIHNGKFFGQDNGPVTINFSTPVVEFRFRFENDNDHQHATTTNSFTPYDRAAPLGTYTGTVVSTDHKGSNLIFVDAEVFGGAISQVILTGDRDDFSTDPISHLPDSPGLLVNSTLVPESGSLMLFGIGLMSLGGLIRRKLRSAQARDGSTQTY
jgi:hypothetical protein